jgi:hypothetical protein
MKLSAISHQLSAKKSPVDQPFDAAHWVIESMFLDNVFVDSLARAGNLLGRAGFAVFVLLCSEALRFWRSKT